MKKLLVLLLLLPSAVLAGTGLIVAPNITYGNGNGTVANPYNFQYAMFVVTAGDSIILRGGTYVPDGTSVVEWEAQVSGTRTSRIVFTNYPGEKVKINALFGRNNAATLVVKGLDFLSFVGRGAPDAFQISNDNETDTLNSTQDGLRLTDNNGDPCDSVEVDGLFFHNIMSVALADQGNRGTVVKNCIFRYNGRKSFSNHGYDIYANRLVGAVYPTPSYYTRNYHSDTYSAFLNLYTQGGQVDSFQISHLMLYRSFVHTFALDEMILMINDTLLGNTLDTTIVIGSYNDLDILWSMQKPDLGTKARGNMFLKGYTQYKDTNRWNVTDQYNIYWGSYPQVDNNAGYFNEDTTKAFYQNRQWYLTSATPPLSDVVRVYKHERDEKRARVFVVQPDSSPTVTISASSLTGEFSTYDTLKIYDLSNPATIWQTTQWTGGDITLTMTTSSSPVWPQSVHYHGATTTFDANHPDQRWGAFEIIGVAGEAPASQGVPSKNIMIFD